MVIANDWDRDADQVFRSIYAKGIVLLKSIEDQRILRNDPSLAPTGKQGLKVNTTTKTAEPVSETDKLVAFLLLNLPRANKLSMTENQEKYSYWRTILL